jgi:4-hydroxybenzoate polyprenyltransferase
MTRAAPAPQPIGEGKLPLAVDLDGTLMRGDLFTEAMLRFCAPRPWRVFKLLGWLMKGRAYAKARLAEAATADPATLPYNEELIAWLRAERQSGRSIVLATASDRSAAQAVADHVGVFDAVHASDGATNLKSKCKAERLSEVFPGGFVYAGNDTADYAVWRAAQGAVVVNAPAHVAKHAESLAVIEQNFARRGGTVRGLLKAMRPRQWSKNVLVFVPMLTGLGWADPNAWAAAFAAFVALSLVASAVYLVNDAADIDADRNHPKKKERPFASGQVSPFLGLALSVLLLCAGFAVGAATNALPALVVYFIVTTLYTFWLKRYALADVFVLAGLYTLRIVLGGAATGYIASDWLLAFSCFFFLSLALVKRVAETSDEAVTAKGDGATKRGYFNHDSDVLTMMGLCAGFVSSLVLALYLQSEQVAARFSEPFLLWSLPVCTTYWIARIWLKTARGLMHHDPIVFALGDRQSWILAAFMALGFAAAALLPRGLI